VQFLDLSLPQFGLPVYDWILCLEVAEHVPKAYEEVLISNIVRHAREGVILSWARPGQEGYSHINNQSPEYVISCMGRLGFELHTQFTDQIRSKTTHKNLLRNINVFVRKETQSVDDLSYNA
jgi:2-polyprenyl-3-methyl-5-hydroxy-6-metoxy-1,4-benzoquinol methylase